MRFYFPGSHIEAGSTVSVKPGGEGPDPTDCIVEFGDGVTVRGHYQFIGDRSIRPFFEPDQCRNEGRIAL